MSSDINCHGNDRHFGANMAKSNKHWNFWFEWLIFKKSENRTVGWVLKVFFSFFEWATVPLKSLKISIVFETITFFFATDMTHCQNFNQFPITGEIMLNKRVLTPHVDATCVVFFLYSPSIKLNFIIINKYLCIFKKDKRDSHYNWMKTKKNCHKYVNQDINLTSSINL